MLINRIITRATTATLLCSSASTSSIALSNQCRQISHLSRQKQQSSHSYQRSFVENLSQSHRNTASQLRSSTIITTPISSNITNSPNSSSNLSLSSLFTNVALIKQIHHIANPKTISQIHNATNTQKWVSKNAIFLSNLMKNNLILPRLFSTNSSQSNNANTNQQSQQQSSSQQNKQAPVKLSPREYDQETKAKNKNTALYAFAVALIAIAMSYAAVPLYRMFCQVTGFGGTVRERDRSLKKLSEMSAEERAKLPKRYVTIKFNADVTSKLPWDFVPVQNSIRVAIGDNALAFFTAKNRASNAIVGVATYNVAPSSAGLYFNKVQCFCFDEQRLQPGEEMDMPVLFFIEPEFLEDPRMDDVNDIVLSYTFFPSSMEDVE